MTSQRSHDRPRHGRLTLGLGLVLAVVASIGQAPAAATAAGGPTSDATSVSVWADSDTIDLTDADQTHSITFTVAGSADFDDASGAYDFSITNASGDQVLDRTGTFDGLDTEVWTPGADGAPVPASGAYTATVRTWNAAGQVVQDSATVSIQAPVPTATLRSSIRSVFPTADGFRDSVTLTGSASTASGRIEAGQGSIRVTTGSGAVVWSRTVTSSARASFDWDGRVAGAVRAGTYTATYTFTGPDGTALTDSLQLLVKTTSAVRASLKPAFRTVYPRKDGYRDGVRLRFGSTSTTGATISGRGSLTVRNARGHVVKTWRTTTSGTRAVTWSGRTSGRVVPGSYTVTYRFHGPQGPTVETRTALRVSGKHLVTVYREKTVTAWGLFRNCENVGDSYEPCDQGDASGHSNGARIYSEGFGTTMVVGSSVAIGGFPVKWRLKFRDADVGFGDPHFYYDATGADRSDASRWHAKMSFPTDTGYDGTTVTTPWSHHAYNGRGRFVLHSSDWASLYLRYITVQAYTRVLR